MELGLASSIDVSRCSSHVSRNRGVRCSSNNRNNTQSYSTSRTCATSPILRLLSLVFSHHWIIIVVVVVVATVCEYVVKTVLTVLFVWPLLLLLSLLMLALLLTLRVFALAAAVASHVVVVGAVIVAVNGVVVARAAAFDVDESETSRTLKPHPPAISA